MRLWPFCCYQHLRQIRYRRNQTSQRPAGVYNMKCRHRLPSGMSSQMWSSYPYSSDIAQKFGFEDIFAFLVFLCCFERLVVLPAYRLFALSACDIANYVFTSGHIALVGLTSIDVDDHMEKVCLPMLSTKVLFANHKHRQRYWDNASESNERGH